jgi:hypothetical protein
VTRQQRHPQAIHGGHASTSSAYLRERHKLTTREKGQNAGLGIHRQQCEALLFSHRPMPHDKYKLDLNYEV